MTWTTEGNTISRADAIAAIKAKAKAEGYVGTYKVSYDGAIVVEPKDLPADVDMAKVTISSMLNNAACAKPAKGKKGKKK